MLLLFWHGEAVREVIIDITLVCESRTVDFAPDDRQTSFTTPERTVTFYAERDHQ